MADDQTRKDATDTGFPFFTAMMNSGSMLDDFMQNGQSCMQAFTDWRDEVLRFYDQRLRAEEKLGAAISECKSLADLLDLQRDWAMAATQDYIEESQRLAQIAAGSFPFWPAAKPGAPRKDG